MHIRIADDGVLVALDRRDDVLHALVGGAAQFLLQHLVDDVEAGFQHEFHAPVADAELALALDAARHLAARRLVAGGADFMVVEQRRDRGAPVIDEGLLRLLVAEIVNADIDGFGVAAAVAADEIHPPEIGRAPELAELQLLGPQHFGRAHLLVDGFAHRDLFDVVHVAARFPHIGLAVLDLLRIGVEARADRPQVQVDGFQAGLEAGLLFGFDVCHRLSVYFRCASRPGTA